jgi:translation initiation factor IF-2
MAKETKIGEISHFYKKISVGIIKLSSTLKVGDKIHIKGHTTDFTEDVDSVQIEHEAVKEAKKGKSIGIKVANEVREGDEVFIAQE